MRVLVIEDEPELLRVLAQALREDGYAVDEADNGTDGLFKATSWDYDAVLLDLMIPGVDGWELLRRLRKERPTPVLILTARDAFADRVRGLDGGADDYVVKPFKPKELVARMRARLRQHDEIAGESLTIGPPEAQISIDVPAHQVSRAGTPISLTPLEFDLLVALARKPRQVFTREVLLEQVWGYRHAADTRLVNVHVQRLRSKVERDPERPEVVLTVRGVGYKAGPP